MKAKEIRQAYEAYCPQELSMEGDISGYQFGGDDAEVERVMVALDIREETVAEAIAKGVDMIIVKHAPIFRPVANLADSLANQIYLDLVKHNITVYVSHTNIDIIPNGLNDWFCQKLGIYYTDILHPTQNSFGIGRVGDIEPQLFQDFARKVKEVFGLDSIRLVSYDQANPLIKRVAICGGSGQSFYKDALRHCADVYITGDIYYHTAQEMLSHGLLALDPGHHIEALFIEGVASKLKSWKVQHQWTLDIIESQANTNPFYHL